MVTLLRSARCLSKKKMLMFIEYIASLFSFFFKRKSNEKELISEIYFDLIFYSELCSTNYKETVEIFNKLLSENTVLSRSEKELLRDRVSRNIEREKELFKRGESFKCSYCESSRYSSRYCENCIIQYLKSLFGTWTSGSDIIDDFICKCQSKSALPLHIMEWISFDQFEDIEYLTNGGFAEIYTATWKRGAVLDWNENERKFVYQGSQKVIIKSLNNSNHPTKEFFEEAEALVNVRSGDIVNSYGITKFPQNGNYSIVMNFFQEGSLRDYLEKNSETMNLKDRMFAIWRICFALSDIHAQDLIHCDLHSGNILMYTKRCLISDLGLCGPVDNENKKLYGIVPYMAPELFLLRKHSKASDIYSLGILMWEIFAGHRPFFDIPHDCSLILRIVKSGLRPPMLSEIPNEIQGLISRCWNGEPSERPTINEILRLIKYQYKQILENEEYVNKNVNKKTTYSRSQKTKNPTNQAYHYSSIISYTIPEEISFDLENFLS